MCWACRLAKKKNVPSHINFYLGAISECNMGFLKWGGLAKTPQVVKVIQLNKVKV